MCSWGGLGSTFLCRTDSAHILRPQCWSLKFWPGPVGNSRAWASLAVPTSHVGIVAHILSWCVFNRIFPNRRMESHKAREITFSSLYKVLKYDQTQNDTGQKLRTPHWRLRLVPRRGWHGTQFILIALAHEGKQSGYCEETHCVSEKSQINANACSFLKSESRSALLFFPS